MTDYAVGDETQLNNILKLINSSLVDGDSNTITLTGDISLTHDLYAISPFFNATVVINGGGHTIDGNNLYRGLMVLSYEYPQAAQQPNFSTPTVTINNVNFAHTAAIGGAGGGGISAGGGGAGLGGGLFVGVNTNVTLNNVDFTNNQATGGAGGSAFNDPSIPGGSGSGGGGGVGGAGGFGGRGNSAGGGGGLGKGAYGQNGSGVVGSYSSFSVQRVGGGPSGLGGVPIPFPVTITQYSLGQGPGAGIAYGRYSAGDGGSRRLDAYFVFHTGSTFVDGGTGAINGGGGGAGYFNAGGGGGIGGQTAPLQTGNTTGPNTQNAGGFGGGGGGGYFGFIPGGTGGFGGGGGGSVRGLDGGNGGFGGGGGGGSANGGMGGFGAGAGSTAYGQSSIQGSGGGALGAGGAIFVQQGGILNFNSGSISSSGVTGGAAGYHASAGSGYGSGIFFQSDSSHPGTLHFSPTANDTLQIDDVITDEKGSIASYVGAGSVNIDVGGSGTVQLGGVNTYTGTTTVEAGGTLALTNDLTQLVGAIIDNGTVVFAETADTSYTHSFSGTGVIQRTGSATVTLGNLSSFSGSLVLDSGSLALTGSQTTITDLSGTAGVLTYGASVTVTLGSSHNSTFSGYIIQSGTLIKQGSGTLTLAGSASGAVTIADGAIRLTGGGDTDFGSGITNNAALILAETSDSGVGRVYGNGSLLRAGSGTATIAGGSTFSGATTITSGTLALAGDVSNWTGAITNSGALVFAPTGNSTFNPLISGSGSVGLNGVGTLTLVAAETITGQVNVAAGTLKVLADSSQFGSSLLVNDRLVFQQSVDSTLNGVVSGTGTLAQAGSGTLTLTVDELLTGTTEVDSGTLRLASGVNLAAAGTLSVQGGTFDLNGNDQRVHNLIGGAGVINIGNQTLTADTIASAFKATVIGNGVLVAGDGATLDNAGTVNNVGFGASGHLINAAGSTISNPAPAVVTGPGVVLGNVSAGTAFTLTNAGTIHGHVSLADGTVTNAHGYASYLDPNLPYFIVQPGLIESGITAAGALSLANAGTIQSGVTLNSGTITNYGADGPGVPLQGLITGGITAASSLVLTNGSAAPGDLHVTGGQITGGIRAGGASTITNFGDQAQFASDFGIIAGDIVLGGAGARVANTGIISNGVTLQAGGTVTNDALRASIGSVTVSGSGLVSNQGTIGTVSVSNGAVLNNGTSVLVNGVSIAGLASVGAGSTLTNFNGASIGTLALAGTATNDGAILGGVSVAAGGMLTQNSHGIAGSLTNSGTVINNGTFGNGGTVGAGGVLTNNNRLVDIDVAGTVFNYGTEIGGTVLQSGSLFNSGVLNDITDNGYVRNTGTVNGVVLSGGTFDNAAGGLLSAIIGGGLTVGSGTFNNAGTVDAGVNVSGSGRVNALAGGTMNGIATVFNGGVLNVDVGGDGGGVNLNGTGTLINAGSVGFIHAFAGGSNLVKLATTAAPVSIDGTGGVTLELMAGTGSIANSLFLADSPIRDFILDSGANWTIAGGSPTNALGLSGAGTLHLSSQLSIASLTNATTLDATIHIGSNGIGLSNLAAGVLTGPITLYGNSLDNSGRITGPVNTQGVVTNHATGTIGNLTAYGVNGIDNSGSITALKGGITGTVHNSGTIGNLDGAFTLDNTGKVSNGLNLRSNGVSVITNAGTATIAGGINDADARISIFNQGTITGDITGGAVGASGTAFTASTLENSGLIDGSVSLTIAHISNLASGVITGAFGGMGTLTNAGLVQGDAHLGTDSVLLNVGGATIAGTAFVQGAHSTLDNAGTIIGGVTLSGDQDKLILSAAAVTTGAIRGSNNNSNTLELRTGSGTVSSVSHFGNLIFDAGADWTFTGNNSFAGATTTVPAMQVTGVGTMHLAGTLTNSTAIGLTVDVEANGSLINQGTTLLSTGQVAGPGQLNAEVLLTGNDAALINQVHGVVTNGVTASGVGAVVDNSGTITGGVTFLGANETLALGAGAITDSVIANADHSTALELKAGNGNVATAGLNLSDFGVISVDAGGHWTTGGNVAISQATTLSGAGTLAIAGTITNTSTIHDSLLLSGGAIDNASNGIILGLVANGSTVTNSGSIGGSVTLTNGVLYNQSGATFGGQFSGGTLNDSGLLANAAISDATLILNAGYSTSGPVTASGASVLALAGNGTLSGFGSEFSGFETLRTDGAWTLSGNTALSGSTTLSGAGTLAVSGTLTDAGTLVNKGNVTGGVTMTAGGTLTNSGVLDTVVLAGTGTQLINQAAGSINGGVAATGDNETIVANGSIGGTGVTLLGQHDTLVLGTGAAPSATATVGNGDVLLLTGSNALSGFGVSLTGFDTIAMATGASWSLGTSNIFDHSVALSNATTMTINSYGDVTNQTSLAFGFTLLNNAVLTNEASGSITGDVTVVGANAAVNEYGVITGSVALQSSGDRVVLASGSSISGGIIGSSDGSSVVELKGSGTLHLGTGGFSGSGTIQLDAGALWHIDGTLTAGMSLTVIGGGSIDVTGLVDAGTLTNTSNLLGTLTVTNGGSVINQAGGTAAGIDLSGTATLDNYGTIGAGGASVNFGAGAGRLIHHAGATMAGSVTGVGNDDTLELYGTYALTEHHGGAYGALYFTHDYTNVGTLGGLGTQITGFGTYAVDHGGAWSLTGANTIGAGGTLVNNGLLLAPDTLVAEGKIVNASQPGTYPSYLYVDQSNPMVRVDGGIQGSVKLVNGGSLVNVGTITGSSYGVAIDGGGDLRNAGSITGGTPVAITDTIAPGSTVSGYGFINSVDAPNNGIIRASGGLLEIGGAVSGTGHLEIDNSATLKLDFVVDQDVFFGSFNTSESLILAQPYVAAGKIHNFAAGDHISLGVPFSSIDVQDSPDDTIVTIRDSGGGIVGQLDFVGDYLPGNLFLDVAGDLSTSQPVPCYCRGTLILTDRGDVAVEDLAIGDRTITASGAARPIKWIGTRSYGGRFLIGRKDILPVCFKAGSLDENVPARDLWISPHHAMYLNGILIEAKDLVNGVSVVQTERVEQVEYFHIELDSHDILLAEGALSESFIDDDSRGMFHNAHEYAGLYPGESDGAVTYCAPRRDEGYEVEGARALIDRRAGLRPAVLNASRALRGHVDRVTPQLIEGWAQDPDFPEAPVCLDIVAGGQLVGQVLANRYRSDLHQAGFGSGQHSFQFAPPMALDFAPDSIEIRRSNNGMVLFASAPAFLRLASAS